MTNEILDDLLQWRVREKRVRLDQPDDDEADEHHVSLEVPVRHQLRRQVSGEKRCLDIVVRCLRLQNIVVFAAASIAQR